MKIFFRSFSFLLLALLLSACGTMKSIFPDKEKDYRFTRELPPLVLPGDLSQRGDYVQPPSFADRDAATADAGLPAVPLAQTSIADVATPAPPAPLPVTPAVQSAPASNVASPKASVAEASIPQTPTVTKAIEPTPAPNAVVQTTPLVETPIDGSKFAKALPDAGTLPLPEIKLIKTSEHTSILRFNQNLDQTWRIVGKALTDKAIEISDHNITARYYVVEYEPTVKKLKDDTWWDDVLFAFGSENNQELTYRVAMREKDKQTDIQVLDAENKLCSTEACAQLTLTLKAAIEKAIKK